MASHVSQLPFDARLEGSFRMGEANSLIAAGNLTSKATALAAVDTAAGKAHVSAYPLKYAVKHAINNIDNVVSGATTGSSLTNIQSGITGTNKGALSSGE